MSAKMIASAALRWIVVLGALAISVRLATLSISDVFNRGELAVYYVGFFFAVTAWRAAGFWRAPLLPLRIGPVAICLALYCAGLALTVGLQYEGSADEKRLPSALFIAAVSACYFGLGMSLAYGHLSRRKKGADGRRN